MNELNRVLNSDKLPNSFKQITSVDMHTGGEPLRVILKGLPEFKGNTVLEVRRELRDYHDWIRTSLIYEPRGHSDMYGCIITAPNDDGADFGVVFIHNEGYSTMCGHAIIALGKLAVELGWVDPISPVTPITIDAPCGRILAEVEFENNKVGTVSFEGVPSFLFKEQLLIDVEGIGELPVDIAYGGAFYAFVDAPYLNLELVESNISQIIDLGMKIKQAVISVGEPQHPFERDLSFLYGTIFTGGKSASGYYDRNVCVFANGEVDRSPTGSGVCARMAILHHQKKVGVGEEIKIESITGSIFSGMVKNVVDYGSLKAVIPRVTGQSFITGTHQFLIDPEDPFKNGFLLR